MHRRSFYIVKMPKFPQNQDFITGHFATRQFLTLGCDTYPRSFQMQNRLRPREQKSENILENRIALPHPPPPLGRSSGPFLPYPIHISEPFLTSARCRVSFYTAQNYFLVLPARFRDYIQIFKAKSFCLPTFIITCMTITNNSGSSELNCNFVNKFLNN